MTLLEVVGKDVEGGVVGEAEGEEEVQEAEEEARVKAVVVDEEESEGTGEKMKCKHRHVSEKCNHEFVYTTSLSHIREEKSFLHSAPTSRF